MRLLTVLFGKEQRIAGELFGLMWLCWWLVHDNNIGDWFAAETDVVIFVETSDPPSNVLFGTEMSNAFIVERTAF